MSGCNHAKGFRGKQRRLKYDKRRDGLRHGPGCKHPKIFPVMTVTAHYGVAQDRGSPKENKPPVHNDNGDLSNFLFYSADTLASVHISTGMHAGGRLLPPVSYISCNGLFFFLPADRCVCPPPLTRPAASGAGDRATPRRSSSVSSLSGPRFVCLADPFTPATRQRWTVGLNLAN